MAEYAVMPKADYQDACDAIREKTGGTEAIKSGGMGGLIRNIKTDPALQSRTVTPSASSIIIKPSSGYDGLSQVTVYGDTDLVPANIVSGKNIFGVAGTAKTGGPPNGTKWTSAESGVSTNSYNDIHYADGIWVLACQLGLYYSTTGKTWTASNVTIQAFSVCHGNGVWVAITSSKSVYTSTDGMTWTERSLPLSSNFTSRCKVVFFNGTFFTYGSASYAFQYYSTDGINWSNNHTTMSTHDIFYSNGLYFCSGLHYATSADCLAYSMDGMTWTPTNKDVTLTAVHYAKGIWVATHTQGSIYSTDGKTWVDSDLPSGNYRMAYGKGLFVAMSIAALNTVSKFFTSTDGVTWTKNETPGGSIYSYYITFGNGIWLCDDYKNGIWCSVNGVTWEKANTPKFYASKIMYNNEGMWVAICSKGTISGTSLSSELLYSVGWEPS